MSQPIPVNPALPPTSLLATLPVAGRTELAAHDSPYPLPNIPEEAERLSLQHFILRAFLRGNGAVPCMQGARRQSAEQKGDGTWTHHILDKTIQHVTANPTHPVNAPRRVLDVGSGNGRWGVEVARQFPQTTVVGVDVVVPAKHYTDARPFPPNYTFTQANLLQGLPFPAGSFDYVHMRCINFGIPTPRWQGVINELARLTAPGGWLESVEMQSPVDGGPAFAQFNKLFGAILAARQIDLGRSRMLDTYLRQCPLRFKQIQSRAFDLPIGAHGGFIGLSMAWNLMLGIQNMHAFFLQAGLAQVEQWEPWLREIDAEFSNPALPTMMPLHVVIGQREG